MLCENCGTSEASRVSYSSSGACSCDRCGKLPGFKFSDVFFKGSYFDPNIADPAKSPWGNHIRSREHKASLMRELGIRERGDKYHGSR